MSVEVVPYAGRKADVQPNNRTFAHAEPVSGSTIDVVGYSGRTKISGGGIWRTSSSKGVEDYYSFRIQPARRSHAAGPQKTEKVVRRINGFLVEDEGEDYKVMLIQDGEAVAYYMPAGPLRNAGIAAPNQPFQMDEIEVKISGDRTMTGYSFSALAKPTDAFNDATELTDERRRKLNLIFKKFGKVKD
jgi:hypothetical protein